MMLSATHGVWWGSFHSPSCISSSSQNRKEMSFYMTTKQPPCVGNSNSHEKKDRGTGHVPLKGDEMFILWLTEEEMCLKQITGVSTKINFLKESTDIQMLTFRNKYHSKMAQCSHPSHLAQSTGTRAAPIWRQTWPADVSLPPCFPLCTALFVSGFLSVQALGSLKRTVIATSVMEGKIKGAPCLLFAQLSPFKWNEEIGWISALEGWELWASCDVPVWASPPSLLALHGSCHCWPLHVGKQHSSGCRAGIPSPCSSSSLIFQLFVHCCREGQSWLKPSHRRACCVCLMIKRGICSCLGCMRILGCGDKQPGWDTDKRNVLV